MPELRIGFAGTPIFAERILRGLLENGVRPTLVLTGPDKPRGRGRRIAPTPVRVLAMSKRITVLTPDPLDDPETLKEIASFSLDLLLVAAYGLILPKELLALPKHGCMNVHPSLLPRWRGAAPIERAIMSGDTETGVCIMRMDQGLDTGPVYDVARTTIDADSTADSLSDQLAKLGVTRLLHVLEALPAMCPSQQAQQGMTYANKITRADQRIVWSLEAERVCRQIHGLNSTAPAHASIESAGARVQVRFLRAKAQSESTQEPPGTILPSAAGSIQVACASGRVSILEAAVLRGSGKQLDARSLRNGFPDLFKPGNRFR